MTWPLRQKWFWMLFLVLLAMVIGTFVIVFVIVSFSPTSLFLTLIAVIIVWVVFRSYRNWAARKPDEEYGRQERFS